MILLINTRVVTTAVPGKCYDTSILFLITMQTGGRHGAGELKYRFTILVQVVLGESGGTRTAVISYQVHRCEYYPWWDVGCRLDWIWTDATYEYAGRLPYSLYSGTSCTCILTMYENVFARYMLGHIKHEINPGKGRWMRWSGRRPPSLVSRARLQLFRVPYYFSMLLVFDTRIVSILIGTIRARVLP